MGTALNKILKDIISQISSNDMAKIQSMFQDGIVMDCQ